MFEGVEYSVSVFKDEQQEYLLTPFNSLLLRQDCIKQKAVSFKFFCFNFRLFASFKIKLTVQ